MKPTNKTAATWARRKGKYRSVRISTAAYNYVSKEAERDKRTIIEQIDYMLGT